MHQDALTFALGFFNYKPPVGSIEPPERPPASAASSPAFYQQVTVAPLDLRVDYMPTVIDYENLLRGQVHEIVNLIRLEGAEVHLPGVRVRRVGRESVCGRLLRMRLTPPGGPAEGAGAARR